LLKKYNMKKEIEQIIPKEKRKAGNPNWVNGKSGNPHGRPLGSRTTAIDIIYRVFNEFGAEKFEKEMKELASKNPIVFYLKFIQPIQPKEMSITPPGSAMSFEIKITPSEAKLK